MATKNYTFVVRGKNIKFIDPVTVRVIKNTIGKIPQSGIRKWGSDYVLQSNSAHDIIDVFRNKCWAHSSSALIKDGMTVYVIPSKAVEDVWGDGAQGVVFTADGNMCKDSNNDFEWTSEK